MQVKYDISVYIYEIVASAFLCIDESLSLVCLIEMVRLCFVNVILTCGARISDLHLGLSVFIGILEAEET